MQTFNTDDITVERVERWFGLLVRIGFADILEQQQAAVSGPPVPVTAAEQAGPEPLPDVVVRIDLAHVLREAGTKGLYREMVAVVMGVPEAEAGAVRRRDFLDALPLFASACTEDFGTLLSLGHVSVSGPTVQA